MARNNRRGFAGAGKRRHTAGHFDALLPVNGALAANLTDLAHVRPVEVRVQPRAAGERAAFDAAVSLLDGVGRLMVSFTLA
ncbi:MAG: hypothetical protein AB7U20_24575, partial [Planctomycetaceae bacterium]